MKRESLPLLHERVLNRLVSYGMKAPYTLDSLPVQNLIKVFRNGLGMTQSQLAKRAGLVQSHLAEIETGKVDIQLTTVQRIFSALQCDVVLLPRFKKKLESILSEQAKKVARNKIARISGSMALEEQLPDATTVRRLTRNEEIRLKRKPTSEIWDD